eukprot:Pgem_evm1s5840
MKSSAMVYIFYSSQKIPESGEQYRFLTMRGRKTKENGSYNGLNRPVLLKVNGETLKGKELHSLGFKTKIVFESRHMYNARCIENSLQRLHHRQPLGVRLWRQVDKGAKYKISEDEKVHKVGLFYNEKSLQDFEGTLKLNE